jgi:hypothetical protein
MNNLTKIIINSNIYYLLDELKSFLISTNNIKKNITTRKLLSELLIPEDDYIFAYYKNNEWILSNGSYSKSKILISEKYYNSLIIINNDIHDNNTNCILLNAAPKLVIDNKELNIEVRYYEKISQDTLLFRVKDIANEFNVTNLKDIISRSNSSFVENEDYKYIKVDGKKGKPFLYFTFLGLIRYAYVSKTSSLISRSIIKWATNILYIHQYGSDKQKSNLASTLINYQSIVSDIFSKFEFPCIYLLNIGHYKEYNNVYKFGRTDNFYRRYKEHNKTYNTICSVCIIQYIDVDYLSKAEVEVKNYMISINALIQVENHDELVVLEDKQIKTVINIYKYISNTYSTKINNLQDNINTLQHEKELLIRDTEIKLLKEQHINEILKKDIQLLTMEIALLKQNKS